MSTKVRRKAPLTTLNTVIRAGQFCLLNKTVSLLKIHSPIYQISVGIHQQHTDFLPFKSATDASGPHWVIIAPVGPQRAFRLVDKHRAQLANSQGPEKRVLHVLESINL